MLTAWGRVLRNRKGQATVELALILPVVLLVLFGIAEFGRAFAAYLALQHAAREGARLGVTGATDLEIIQRIHDSAPVLDPSRLSVTIVPAEGSRASGVYLTISLSYRFDFDVPLIQDIAGTQIALQAQLSMMVE